MAPPIEPPLTQTQRAYLAAFDRYLRGEPGAAAGKAKALGAVLDEAQLSTRPRRPRFRRSLDQELAA
jgi:hypothetical protein